MDLDSKMLKLDALFWLCEAKTPCFSLFEVELSPCD